MLLVFLYCSTTNAGNQEKLILSKYAHVRGDAKDITDEEENERGNSEMRWWLTILGVMFSKSLAL